MLRRELVVVVAGLTLVTVVMTYPLARFLSGQATGTVDPLFNAWVLGWVADRLGHGIAGLAGVFDAPILYPYRYTLAHSEHLLGVAVFAAPIYWLTGNSLLTYNVALLFSFVLAGTGMYLLARTLTGRRDAAFVAALAFAFCPYRYVQLPLLQMLMSGWTPIALWALHTYFRRGSSTMVIVLAVAVNLQALTSWYFPYFLAITAGVIGISEWYQRRPPPGRTVAHLAIAGGITVAALLPVALVYSRALRAQDFGNAAHTDVARPFAADLGSYLQTDPRIAVYRWRGGEAGSEQSLFPGVLALCLAGVGLFTARSETQSRRRARGVLATGWRVGVPAAAALVVTLSLVVPGGGRWAAVALYVLMIRAVIPPPATIEGAYGVIAFYALVLSLGTDPTAWGVPFIGTLAPYGLLERMVPGLEALRVPARFGMVVHLGIAVLAGFGAARLLSKFRGATAIAVSVALAAGILAEGYGAPLSLVRIPRVGSFDDRQAYAWLGRQAPSTLIELPIGDLAAPHNARIVQDSTLLHGHRSVNGSSRLGSAVHALLGDPASPLARPEQVSGAIDFLQALQVEYVVVHQSWYGDKQAGAAAVAALQARAVEKQIFSDTLVFRLPLRPGPPDSPLAGRPISPSQLQLTASAEPGQLPNLLDGNLDTGWNSGAPQRGGEWLRIDLSAPVEVVGLRLTMRAFLLREYPRHLVVDGSVDGASFQPLFDGTVLPEMGRAFLQDHVRIGVDIPWPVRPVRVVRIRQVGNGAPWPWGIQELELLGN